MDIIHAVNETALPNFIASYLLPIPKRSMIEEGLHAPKKAEASLRKASLVREASLGSRWTWEMHEGAVGQTVQFCAASGTSCRFRTEPHLVWQSDANV